MAEAHSAVAFTFTVTPDGDFDVSLNWLLLEAVWHNIVKSAHSRSVKFRNAVHNGVYPLKPIQWLTFAVITLGLSYFGLDLSGGLIDYFEECRPMSFLSGFFRHFVAACVFCTILYLAISVAIRQAFKILLSYKGWMNDEFGRGTTFNKVYLKTVQYISQRSPLLHSLQGSLPNMPLPKLDNTINRFLLSVEPLHTTAEQEELRALAEDFRNGIGPKLQRYVWLKWLTSVNYVTDWWEEYVYLKGRSPIMVNSNFYGVDLIHKPTHIQAARAANLTFFCFKFRDLLDHEQIPPIYVSNSLPLCSSQYERQFNTTRVPGEEHDTIVHHEDSRHVVVLHNGRYFKVTVFSGGRLLEPIELERTFQAILDDESEPVDGELHLAALTAGSRTPWAIARKFYFSEGINRVSLRDIEHAAFVVVMDDEDYENGHDSEKLSRMARAMLHGKCYDRWFDKSFNLCIGKTGAAGFNGEHSWADAPIMSHMWEYILGHDCHVYKYKADGHCNGRERQPGVIRPPIRLQWNLVPACVDVIESSLKEAEVLAQDVDICLYSHTQFGKGLIKKFRISPDAFVQHALQLAQFRDQGRFCLTYESTMTRMYREGRTETLRACTNSSCAFVKSLDDPTKTADEKKSLLAASAKNHQNLYKASMAGQGIDRHMFCLYVVCRWLGADSPFLKKAISEPWRLSTSQTPTQQAGIADVRKYPDMVSPGGGFGPVADDGYGVSYIIYEDVIIFHVSSKRSCENTDSTRMAAKIVEAMADMKSLYEESK